MLVDQLIQALTLFGLGMGTVFVLLGMLILCVSILSKLCQKLEKPAAMNTSISAAPSPKAPAQDSQEIAAATAAVKQHRAKAGL